MSIPSLSCVDRRRICRCVPPRRRGELLAQPPSCRRPWDIPPIPSCRTSTRVKPRPPATTWICALSIDLGDFGRLRAQLNYTYIQQYELVAAGSLFDLAGTHGPSTISGDTGNPRSRATASLTWESGPFSSTISVNYQSSFSITDPTIGANTCLEALKGRSPSAYGSAISSGVTTLAPQWYPYCAVGHFTDTNLYAELPSQRPSQRCTVRSRTCSIRCRRLTCRPTVAVRNWRIPPSIRTARWAGSSWSARRISSKHYVHSRKAAIGPFGGRFFC